MPKKNKKSNQPGVHEELKGFNIQLNEFGELSSNIPVDELNEFLNENVEDKKLKEAAEDLSETKKTE